MCEFSGIYWHIKTFGFEKLETCSVQLELSQEQSKKIKYNKQSKIPGTVAALRPVPRSLLGQPSGVDLRILLNVEVSTNAD
ncbi:MAG: hypothetical protein WCT23_08675 [Candidatus Neomarinimicrobiota bacterium]